MNKAALQAQNATIVRLNASHRWLNDAIFKPCKALIVIQLKTPSKNSRAPSVV
jgi:hypothetical protein